MTVKLAKGVNLHVLPTEKYKTIRIFMRFNTKLDRKIITKRTLLSSLMETNSLNYPDQTLMSEKLAELYGAGFGLNVNKKGNLHWLNLSMSIVNDKYLNGTDVLGEAVSFIKEIVFFPHIIEDHFDQETFDREKENTAAYLKSVNEDKQTYAALSLQNLYFSDSEDQRIPSFGTLEDLEKETAQSMAAYYSQMIREDQVDIFVLGDVEEKQIHQLFSALPFTDREEGIGEIYYHHSISNVIKERSDQEELAQSKLNIGYDTNIFYGDQDYFSLQIFNGVFGGFPHSKLFMNVREKENLAYYASSSLDTFRGMLTVQTGIDGRNREKVLRLVATELENMRRGQITEEELSQTKAMLKNQYLLSLDNGAAVLESAYMDFLLPETQLSAEEWIRRMEAVTIKDIQKIAEGISMQAIFFLEGEQKNG
ncbi:EF-P 5-aminopentanol modification-associated protein YfmF [Enterococcus sp. CWB-B31]|uniref:EF-P 5-aminopentanol modification-associated protein YfmF n=1 Tax=Enterococcus sp. CWB-B31 TaxID=2885159 RepID=UPI001E65E1C9|nr:pitrilysin family protein [Enterococcus sp. CWB-B31]MCB5954857.1 insulinase family protein [Enterococcus sp. CWB-B31]